MEETKHQHIVPACYLANWGINGNQGRESEIYFFNVANRKVQISALQKFPTANYFYDIPELGENKQLLEKFFCKIEGEYSTLLKKTLQCIENQQKARGKKVPAVLRKDRNELAAQFAIQIVRTQAFRNFYKYIHSTLQKVFPWGNIPAYTSSDFQKLHTDAITSFSMANFYANLLSDRNWAILINHSDIPFFTSDNPGIFINHSKDLSKPISPVAEEVTFYMPLSPKVAVELYHKNILKTPEMYIPIDFSGIIQGYNKKLWDKCIRFMFSNKSDFSCLIGSEK